MPAFLGKISCLTVSVIATAAVSANQLVGSDGAPVGANGVVLGVAETDAAAGEAVSVQVLGIRDFVAPAPIARDALVASNANGNPVTTADAAVAFGRCIQAANVAGDRCVILIK